MLVEQAHHVAQLAGATDEARQLRRQVVVGALDGPQARELLRERGVADLVDPLRLAQPAEPVGAEVEEFDLRWETSRQQFHGRLGQYELATVGARRQPGATVDGSTEVVTVADGRDAGVHTDAHLEVESLGGLHERELHGERGLDRAAGVLERHGKAVTGGGEDVAVVLPDDRTDPPVVLGERFGHRVRRSVPERGRALDVGEEERDIALRWTHRRGHPDRHPATRTSSPRSQRPAVSSNATCARSNSPVTDRTPLR